MLNSKLRQTQGSLIAENLTVLYVLVFLLALPLLNLSVVGFRSFFLWFAAEQAAMAASKARSYFEPTEDSNNTICPSACQAASKAANAIKLMLSGINWEENENNPDVQIIREPINPKAIGAKPEKIFTRGNGAPLIERDEPDQSANIYVCRVVIEGSVSPLITLSWFDFPGLASPIELRVSSEVQYENVSGLRM